MNSLLLSNIQSGLKNLTSRNAFIILLILGCLTYGNAVNHPFVHDDVVFIQQNPEIQDLDLPKIFLHGTSPQEQNINLYYRPVLEVVYRLQYKLFQLNPAGFHFINILLHVINAFLVFLFCRFLFKEKSGREMLSLLVAIVFLVHPVQSEAVACISGISNTLFGLLCLLALNGYCYGLLRPQSERKVFFLVIALVAFFAALFTKEQAIMLPLVIILYGLLVPLNKDQKRRVGFHSVLFFLVVAGYFSFRRIIFGSALKVNLVFDYEFWLRMLSIPATLLEYLRIIFLPYDLHYYRSKDILDPYLLPLLALIIIVIGLIVWIVKLKADDRRYVLFGILWFGLWLLPVLNFIPIINEYSTILTSEHFLYLPVIGILITAFSVLEKVYHNKDFKTGLVMFSLVTLVFIGITIKQNTYWKNEVVLFERVVKYEQNFARGHNLLAKAYFQHQRYEEAILTNEKALGIMQGYLEKAKGTQAEGFYLGFIKGIHFDLAQYYQTIRLIPKTLEHYQKAIAIDPGDGIILNNIATVYLSMGKIELAFDYLLKSVEYNPDNALAWNNLAICYIHRNELDKAEESFRRALAYDPGLISAKDNLERLMNRP